MRCPKCSFTSFDHLVTCEKCGRDLTEIVGQVHGTSLKVESPLFLRPALKVPAAEETFDVAGGIEDVDVGLEVDSSQAADAGAEDFFAAEEIALDREPDQAMKEAPSTAGLPDEVELRLQMEGDAKETAAEIKPETKSAGRDEVQPHAAESSAPAAEVEEGQAVQTGLNFEGIDLSDLSPAENRETEGGESGNNDEERPLDLWSLDTSGDNDLADLFDELLPPGKTQAQAPAANEQAAAKGGGGGHPAESATATDVQLEKDDR